VLKNPKKYLEGAGGGAVIKKRGRPLKLKRSGRQKRR